MKQLNKIFILLSILILSSCEEWGPVFTGKYDDPEPEKLMNLTPTHTIAELVGMYTIGTPKLIEDEVVISGIVSTTDQPGNFYKSLYIQDETGGIELKIGRNALYNEYRPGQRLYVYCRDLTIGMYGYKSGSGNGLVNIGFVDTTSGKDYETSSIESQMLIDNHIFKGAYEGEVEPVEMKTVPVASATQVTNHLLGKLVTVKNLTYRWTDSYNTINESFVLLYLDSTKDKDESSNRIFVSGSGFGIDTWAMSKAKMTEYLYSGKWDNINIGNSGDYNYGTVGDHRVVDENGKVSYPGIEKAAGTVSQYFSLPNGTGVQIRTSGYSKFADTKIPQRVLDGFSTVNVTGILSFYRGQAQIIVNNIDDITFNDN